MKQPLYTKLGFEIVFAATIIAIFALPAVVYGRSERKIAPVKTIKKVNAEKRLKDTMGVQRVR